MGTSLASALLYPTVVILILAVLENLVVLLVLAKSSHLRLKYFAFVFNLTMTDLTFAAMALVYLVSRPRAISALLQVCVAVSVLTILAVAINRYLALTISPPARYDALVTRCRLFTVCLLMWCFALVTHLPVMFIASEETRLILSAWVRSPIVLALWVVTATLYFVVFNKIKSYVPPLASCPGVRTVDEEQATTRLRQTRQLLVTFSIVLVTSFISWMLLNIGQIMEYFSDTDQSTTTDDKIADAFNWVAFSVYCVSPAINPLIYWWRLDGFRQGFKTLFSRGTGVIHGLEPLGEAGDSYEDGPNTETKR